jgi:hypothetical protein
MNEEQREALWARYEAESGPLGNAEVAQMLGAAYAAPGQRTAQDAFPSGRPMNILDLTHFEKGWRLAREFDLLVGDGR